MFTLPDWQCLIFASKQLEDASKAYRDAYLPLPDQQRLIFAGKQLENASKAYGEAYLPLPDQQRLIFAGKQLEDVCLPPPDQQRVTLLPIIEIAQDNPREKTIHFGGIKGQATCQRYMDRSGTTYSRLWDVLLETQFLLWLRRVCSDT
jgi:ubiquitin